MGEVVNDPNDKGASQVHEILLVGVYGSFVGHGIVQIYKQSYYCICA
jgi:hypothetical protein